MSVLPGPLALLLLSGAGAGVEMLLTAEAGTLMRSEAERSDAIESMTTLKPWLIGNSTALDSNASNNDAGLGQPRLVAAAGGVARVAVSTGGQSYIVANLDDRGAGAAARGTTSQFMKKASRRFSSSTTEASMVNASKDVNETRLHPVPVWLQAAATLQGSPNSTVVPSGKSLTESSKAPLRSLSTAAAVEKVGDLHESVIKGHSKDASIEHTPGISYSIKRHALASETGRSDVDAAEASEPQPLAEAVEPDPYSDEMEDVWAHPSGGGNDSRSDSTLSRNSIARSISGSSSPTHGVNASSSGSHPLKTGGSGTEAMPLHHEDQKSGEQKVQRASSRPEPTVPKSSQSDAKDGNAQHPTPDSKPPSPTSTQAKPETSKDVPAGTHTKSSDSNVQRTKRESESVESKPARTEAKGKETTPTNKADKSSDGSDQRAKPESESKASSPQHPTPDSKPRKPTSSEAKPETSKAVPAATRTESSDSNVQRTKRESESVQSKPARTEANGTETTPMKKAEKSSDGSDQRAKPESESKAMPSIEHAPSTEHDETGDSGDWYAEPKTGQAVSEPKQTPAESSKTPSSSDNEENGDSIEQRLKPHAEDSGSNSAQTSAKVSKTTSDGNEEDAAESKDAPAAVQATKPTPAGKDEKTVPIDRPDRNDEKTVPAKRPDNSANAGAADDSNATNKKHASIEHRSQTRHAGGEDSVSKGTDAGATNDTEQAASGKLSSNVTDGPVDIGSEDIGGGQLPYAGETSSQHLPIDASRPREDSHPKTGTKSDQPYEIAPFVPPSTSESPHKADTTTEQVEHHPTTAKETGDAWKQIKDVIKDIHGQIIKDENGHIVSTDKDNEGAPYSTPSIGPFSAGSPLVRKDLPVIVDQLPPVGAIPIAPLQKLSPQDQPPLQAPFDRLKPTDEEQPGIGDIGSGNFDGGSEDVDDMDADVDEWAEDSGRIDADDNVEEQTEEDAQTVISVGQPLKAHSEDKWLAPSEPDVLKLGEGVGSLAYDRSPTGSRSLNRDLRRRLELQDCATIAMLLAIFALTIFVSCYGIYQVADDPSPVTFYSDPKFNQRRLTCASADVDSFLQAFNGQPQNARLRIIGTRSEEEGFRALLWQGRWGDVSRQFRRRIRDALAYGGLIRPRQRPYPLLFDVSLDLTPFITGDGRLSTPDDAVTLQKYINSSNPLEVVALRKKVTWSSWEDVATNVRQRLRMLGCQGEVEVRFEAEEEVIIYRNHPWQNFVRSRITQALVLISVVGGVFWLPYLWVRMRKVKVEATFHISLDLQRYWDLFSEGLHPTEGFLGT